MSSYLSSRAKGAIPLLCLQAFWQRQSPRNQLRRDHGCKTHEFEHMRGTMASAQQRPPANCKQCALVRCSTQGIGFYVAARIAREHQQLRGQSALKISL